MAPVFSAIICTHDRPRYLRACLEGLAQQADTSLFETLVVDSATPAPGSAEIASIVAAHPHVRLIRTDITGVSLARNLGANAAYTDWAAYLDDDAVPEKDWAQHMAARIDALPDDVACIGGRIRPHWEGQLPEWWPVHWLGALTIIDEDGTGYTEPGEPFAHIKPFGANMAVRISALRQVGGFPEKLGRIGKNLLSCEEPYVVHQLERSGFRGVYDGSVSVMHSIQAHRLTVAWILDRVHWQGVSDAAMARMLGNSKTTKIKALRIFARNSYKMPWLSVSKDNAANISRRCSAIYALGYLRGAYASRS